MASASCLKQAEFKILDVVHFPKYGVAGAAIAATADYDLHLERGFKGETVVVKISQALAPNEVDRFTFTVGSSNPILLGFDWYFLEMTLKYNETNQTVEADKILLSIPPLRKKSIISLKKYIHCFRKKSYSRRSRRKSGKSTKVVTN